MAIVKMKKFTLLTFETYKKELLKELQRFENVHFKNLSKEDFSQMDFLKYDFSAQAINDCEAEVLNIKFALDKIEPYVVKPKGIEALMAPIKSISADEFEGFSNKYDYKTTFDNIKSADDKLNAIKSNISRLNAENDGLKNWLGLDLDLSSMDKMKYVKAMVGSISRLSADSFRTAVEENFSSTYIEFVGNIKDDITAFIITPSEEYDELLSYMKDLGFSKISLGFAGTPSEIIKKNNSEITSLKIAQSEAIELLKLQSAEYNNLSIALDYYESILEREKACINFMKTESVFLIEGWIPYDESVNFMVIVNKVCGSDFYVEQEEVEKESEEVPIKLKNNKFFSAFEDITVMFSLPKYNEIDPTPLLAPFYFLFFGLMIGDTGYGLIMLVATAIALSLFNLKEGTKKFIKFFFYLSFSVIFAGFIYGSMFGFTFFAPIQMPDGTHKAILDSQKDVMVMMVLAVAIGVIQVLFGIAVKGYMLIKDGKVLDAIFDSLFWIIALVGGIGWLLGAAGVVSVATTSASKWAFIASLIGLAATQGRDNATLGAKIGAGLYGVYGISGYIGDLVSYTRLAALALSGAYIAFSFNLMAGLIPAGVSRVVFGTIIIILGQTLNLGLGALGAYVHTCRLQYVEFFGKFYEGGGVPFDSFKFKNKYINIKK